VIDPSSDMIGMRSLGATNSSKSLGDKNAQPQFDFAAASGADAASTALLPNNEQSNAGSALLATGRCKTG
jgi:hypothetical protein